MKIHVFQSYQGDCLLVEDDAGQHRMLCDGGTPTAMRDHIAAELANWQAAGKEIDLVYISHIDQDHIGGIAVWLDLMVQWKVFDANAADGDPSPAPDLPRQPAIHRIWHNAFRDLIKNNTGEIEELLAAAAPMLQVSQAPELVAAGREYARIATSVAEALTVSRLIKPDLLDVGLNVLHETPQHSGKLLMARAGQAKEQVGGLSIEILCPAPAELDKLRTGWDNWLRVQKNRKTARTIRDHYAGVLESSATFDFSVPEELYDWPARLQDSPELHEWEGTPAYKGVTTPNVASTVLLVEEANKTLLLTGDNHPDMIIAGLQSTGRLGAGNNSHLHVDVLKYPHHGSEHNISQGFAKRITARHYVFCGDGSNTNPEISVLNQMFAARVGPPSQRALTPEAQNDEPFKFWFSTSPSVQAGGGRKDHMEAVVAWAKAKKQQHPAVFSYELNANPSMTIVP
jgi:hypothetical protein